MRFKPSYDRQTKYARDRRMWRDSVTIDAKIVAMVVPDTPDSLGPLPVVTSLWIIGKDRGQVPCQVGHHSAEILMRSCFRTTLKHAVFEDVAFPSRSVQMW